ncbi:MAG TPA: HAD hydrolase family protein, partial [Candidatus Limnocylindrales bacterium]|nr:HAD hydrolase family protein [Candidatus Limnocylindrales bacterium]
DGGLIYGASGEERKRFDVQDGLALVAARRAGLEIAIMSGRASPAVTRRMSELGLAEIHQGVDDKALAARAVLDRLGLTWTQVAAMGDDLPDLPLLRAAGLALAPANAVPEVRKAAHWIARRSGGAGAVRDAVEMILKARKAWPPPDRRT